MAKLSGNSLIGRDIFLESPFVDVSVGVLRRHINAADALQPEPLAFADDFTCLLTAHEPEQFPRGFFLSCSGRDSITPAADPTVFAVLLARGAGGQWWKRDCIVQVLTVLRQHFWKGPITVDLHRNFALDKEIEFAGRRAALAGLRRPLKGKFLLRPA